MSSLRHVLVVGGTTAEWQAMGADRWDAVLADLGKVVEHAGAEWLTLHPDQHAHGGDGGLRRTLELSSCTVVADPLADGRQRLVAAMRAVAEAGLPLTEEAITARVNAPAAVEPDLIVVLGRSDRVPPSLVWELAYGELVYVDVPWTELQPRHLEDAVNAFTARHRRFGGID